MSRRCLYTNFLLLLSYFALTLHPASIHASSPVLKRENAVSLSLTCLQQGFARVSVQTDQKELTQELISQFQDVHQSEVRLRGFLFKSPSGRWLLSAEPDLKSCCAGSPLKVSKQVFLDGNYEEEGINKLVEMRGIFTIDLKRNHEGELVQVFALREAILTDEVQQTTPWITLLVLAVGSLGGGWLIWRRYCIRNRGLHH